MRVIGPYAGWSCLLIVIILLILSAGCTDRGAEQGSTTVTGEEYRTVVDSRGVAVQVPMNIERVVGVSDGFIEGTMTVFGVQDTIVGVGSKCLQRGYDYTFPTVSGDSYEYTSGMNPVTYLNPRIKDLPIVAEWGGAMNYETLVSLNPDLVILRIGSGSLMSKDDEKTLKTIDVIESLDIPLIVLYSPNCYDYSELRRISDEILILGKVFGKDAEAVRLARYLESQVDLVQKRTAGIPESERPTALIFGLSPHHRKEGASGTAHGLKTTDSYMLEGIVNAKNAFQSETGIFQMLSTEQVLALDPDIILLCTAWGYHPPKELYTAPYYQNLQELTAVKNHRVYALPWTPCNSDKRLEYPIDVMVMAKAAYPELFEDIVLSEWLLDFYKNVYGVDHDTAIALRSAQWMDWCVEDGI